MSDLFKAQVVLELEKDNAFYSSKHFRNKILEKYGFIPDSDIYKKIVNYQIDKYGETLSPWLGNSKTFLTTNRRNKQNERAVRRYHSRKILERIEQNERENLVHS